MKKPYQFKVSEAVKQKSYNNPFVKKRGRKPIKANFEMHY